MALLPISHLLGAGSKESPPCESQEGQMTGTCGLDFTALSFPEQPMILKYLARSLLSHKLEICFPAGVNVWVSVGPLLPCNHSQHTVYKICVFPGKRVSNTHHIPM